MSGLRRSPASVLSLSLCLQLSQGIAPLEAFARVISQPKPRTGPSAGVLLRVAPFSAVAAAEFSAGGANMAPRLMSSLPGVSAPAPGLVGALPAPLISPAPAGSGAREFRRPDATSALRDAALGPKADFAPVADGSRAGLGRLEEGGSAVLALPGGETAPRNRLKMTRIAVKEGLKGVPNPIGSMAAGWISGKMRAAFGAAETSMRDPILTNSLLAKARRLQDDVSGDAESPMGLAIAALSESILTGNYEAARRHLKTVADAPLEKRMEGQRRLRDSLVMEMAAELPASSLAVSAALAAALSEVRRAALADPFGLQSRLSGLVQGVALSNIPDDLRELQIRLTKKASAAARERALARPVKGETILQQKYEDCWPQAFYHMPIPAMAAVRAKMTYEQFLAGIEAMFPEKDVKISGLTMEEFKKVLARHGLTMTSHAPSQEELAALIEKHGAVLGAIGWFDKDVSDLDGVRALPYWHQHAVALVGTSEEGGARTFIVRDSLAPTRVRYTMAELDVMSFVAFVIE